MKNKDYLTFRLHNLQYAIEATLVQEILPLPEFTPVIEANVDIIGLLNLRGKIVPIIHLDPLQDNLEKHYSLSDRVIVMQWEELQIGLVVNQVDEVLILNDELIESEPFDGIDSDNTEALISGSAKIDSDKILLLNPNTLVRQPDVVLTLIWDAQSQLDVASASSISNVEEQLKQEISQSVDGLQISTITSSFYDLYCPSATPEERSVFRQRADNIRQSIESLKVANELMALAVISFGNEYFGLSLELVREFTNVGNLTPIPCCPNHIVGNMNLRGEIVTLVDIRNVFNLPTTPVSLGSPALVVQVDDIVAGLPVDRVLEMVSLNSADLAPLPAVLPELGEQYVQGTALFEEKTLRVLDLPKIFTRGQLAVNEQA